MTPKPGRDVTRKKKHKPQANVPHEHQCKNCKQISSKSNSYFLKGQYAMTRGGLSQEWKVSWHSESASAAHHINMLKRGYIKIRRSNIWQNPIPAPDQSKAGLELEGPPQFDEASTLPATRLRWLGHCRTRNRNGVWALRQDKRKPSDEKERPNRLYSHVTYPLCRKPSGINKKLLELMSEVPENR